MLNKSHIAVALMLCPLAFAQGNFSGPGVLSRDSGSVGQRSGQDVDLRYFVNASAIYDTGMTPYVVSSLGTLVLPGTLSGVEVGLGAYGRHTFRRSAVGLDYAGNFRHYPANTSFDGSNQQLNLSYTYQKSRRLVFDFGQNAGTQSVGTAFGAYNGTADALVDSSSLLFDNRTSYLQSSMHTRYALSGRTSISMGGSFYSIHRQSSALVGVRGYNLQGSINRQLSRRTTIGANYQHTHYDFPRSFGQSDIDMYTGSWNTTFGRSWILAISGGIFRSQVQGLESTALDPAIAALLGITSVQTIFYKENIIPMGQASITKSFRRSVWSANYGRTVTPGNGVFLTSRQETYGTSYSYTGFRRWSLSISGGVSSLNSLGQTIQSYSQWNGTANVGYLVGAGFNIAGYYSQRHQDVKINTFLRDSSRVSIGIVYSPGSIPISFH